MLQRESNIMYAHILRKKNFLGHERYQITIATLLPTPQKSNGSPLLALETDHINLWHVYMSRLKNYLHSPVCNVVGHVLM